MVYEGARAYVAGREISGSRQDRKSLPLALVRKSAAEKNSSQRIIPGARMTVKSEFRAQTPLTRAPHPSLHWGDGETIANRIAQNLVLKPFGDFDADKAASPSRRYLDAVLGTGNLLLLAAKLTNFDPPAEFLFV